MRGRPALYTDYAADQAMLNTATKRTALGVFLVFLVALPFLWPAHMSNDINTILARTFMAAIGAIGINIVTGYAGQVSLGHAFFLGLGAYTAAVLQGEPGRAVWGLGIDNMLIWLPIAGLVPALVGLAVAPIAMRVRGLYLAIVTLGLVFVGQHFFNAWRDITGGAGVGRRTARPVVFGFDFRSTSEILGVTVTRAHKLYFLGLICVVVLALLAANFVRSDYGRAFAAVRDRDIAAEAMGVNLLRTKAIAFAVSSFYAGIAGALLSTTLGSVTPEGYDLLLSVEYLAMILIGGMATMSGSFIGAGFVVALPRLIEEVPSYVPFVTPGTGQGGLLNVFQLQTVLYGALIIAFLILEPRGVYGLWVRVRNYFKAWPFSY